MTRHISGTGYLSILSRPWLITFFLSPLQTKLTRSFPTYFTDWEVKIALKLIPIKELHFNNKIWIPDVELHEKKAKRKNRLKFEPILIKFEEISSKNYSSCVYSWHIISDSVVIWENESVMDGQLPDIRWRNVISYDIAITEGEFIPGILVFEKSSSWLETGQHLTLDWNFICEKYENAFYSDHTNSASVYLL